LLAKIHLIGKALAVLARRLDISALLIPICFFLHLTDNVFGARLHISSLTAPKGIGIEFLEYLTPRDGKPFPADERANDLVHWQTSMIVEDTKTVAQQLQDRGYGLVSSGVVTLSDRKLGFRRGFLVRDPDGHVLRIIEK
jgi:hypothetical protein